MYKKNTYELGMPRGLYRKIWLIMRLTTIIILITFLHVSAATHAQNVTLNKSNASLKSVFNDIKKQTGYLVLYPSALINKAKPVTVNLNDSPLKEALDQIFANQNLEFEIQDNSIVVREKQTTLVERMKVINSTNASGSVIDENAQPLVGATIRVKNGLQSALTDKDGVFFLKGIPEHSLLVITYIGYKEKQISVDEELINIRMEISNSKLDEVQVQAYGTTSKRISTGNIATIKAADIEKQPVHNPIYALMGRVPGLVITPTSGLQGAAVKVQLRGQNSLSNVESEPLFVVDGVPYLSSMVGTQSGQPGLETISPLSFINPNDIESINVLKDADATSIYGSRGANGVILITTKKGKVGQTSVNASFRTNLTQVPQFTKMMNTSEYLSYRKEAFRNSGAPVPDSNIPDGDKNVTNYDLTLWDQNRYTDWQKLFLSGTGKSYFADLGISGGNGMIQYLISGQYSSLGSIQLGNNQSRNGNLHFNISGASSNQKLKISLTGTYSGSSSKQAQDLTIVAFSLPPNAPALYSSDGQLNWEPNPTTGISSWDQGNPLAKLLNRTENNNNTLGANADLNYQITGKLKFSTQLGMTKIWYNSFTPYNIAAKDPFYFSTATGAASLNNNGGSTFSVAPQLSYLTTISKGTLNILTGASYQSSDSESQFLYVRGYTNDAMIRNLNAGVIDIGAASNTSNQYKYGGIFGRINYNWQDKYVLNLAGRRDGSSRFAPGNRFGDFASAAGAWIFTNESFLSKKTGPLSYGKFRISYGSSGNDNIGDYRYLETYQFNGGNYQGTNTLATNGPANPEFHWESTKKLEFGTDLGFLNDRFLVSFAYFRNRSSSQLLDYATPITTGGYSVSINLDAKIQQSGMEASFNANLINANIFSWKIGGNISFLNKNKLIALNNGGNFPLRITNAYDVNGDANHPKVDPVGKPYANVIGVAEFRGVDPQTGNYTFAASDNSTVTSPLNFQAYGYAKTINTTPKYYGGISNDLRYKNVSLSIFLQFAKQIGKNPIYLPNFSPGTPNNQPELLYTNTWHAPGDHSSIQKPTVYFDNADGFAPAQRSDVAYVDASFIRFKNVALSYQVPEQWLKPFGIKGMSMFVNAQNLFTITGYKGVDPESQSLTALPPLRELSIGVNIGL